MGKGKTKCSICGSEHWSNEAKACWIGNEKIKEPFEVVKMGKGKTKTKCSVCGAEIEHASRKMSVLCVCGQTYTRVKQE